VHFVNDFHEYKLEWSSLHYVKKRGTQSGEVCTTNLYQLNRIKFVLTHCKADIVNYELNTQLSLRMISQSVPRQQITLIASIL